MKLLKKDEILGRNDLCPKCGKKGKYCRGHVSRPVWLAAAGLTAVFLAACLYIAATKHADRQTEQRSERLRPTKDTFQDHAHSRPPDQWWASTPPQMLAPDEYLKLAQQIFAQANRIKGLLAEYRHVSPLADDIARAFQNQTVSIFTNGVSMTIEDPNFTGNGIKSDIEICFVPQDQTKLLRQGSAFFFRRDWNALMLPAVEYPNAVLSGLLFHELGHALRYKQGALSSKAASFSDSWIEEEIEMHQLETAILDEASGDRFVACIDSFIVRKKHDLTTAKDAVLCAKKDDLEHLDEILDAQQSGPVVSNVLTAQYALSIGLHYLEHYQHNATIKEKIALYRWLTRF